MRLCACSLFLFSCIQQIINLLTGHHRLCNSGFAFFFKKLSGSVIMVKPEPSVGNGIYAISFCARKVQNNIAVRITGIIETTGIIQAIKANEERQLPDNYFRSFIEQHFIL
jgi:hypothetical protein